MAPFRIGRPRFLAYFAFEGGLIFAVIYGLAILTTRIATLPVASNTMNSVILDGALFSLVLLFIQGANLGDQRSLRRELIIFSLICAVIGAVGFAAMWVLFGDRDRLYSLVLLEGAVAVPLVVGLWRWISVKFNFLNPTRESVLIVGTGEDAKQVCRWICENHRAEYAVAGFAAEEEDMLGNVLTMGVRVQTDFAQLSRYALPRIDRVIVSLKEKRGRFPVRQLMELRLRGIEIEDATTFLERISGKISVETMLPSWLIFSDGFKTSALRSVVKRIADIVLAVPLLIVTLPLMALFALMIKLDSRGPVVFRQARLGRDGHEFNLLKFRSMVTDAEADGPRWAQANDPRVTRIGRFMRKTRIDELPQLFNVLAGKMSFVGPRPERAHFVRQLEEKIPYYGLRMSVRPGLTGWAQVEYGYGATDEDALEKLKFDLYYIKNNNLFLDLYVVLKTVGVVLRGSNAH